MKNHTHVKKLGAHLRISFWHLLMNSEKPEKSEFWKNEKKLLEKLKKKKKTIAHFTHVYQKLQPYEEQFLRYRVRQLFCHFGPFFAL